MSEMWKWQQLFFYQQKEENDHRKYFMINLHERMLPNPRGDQARYLLITSRSRIWLSHRDRPKKSMG